MHDVDVRLETNMPGRTMAYGYRLLRLPVAAPQPNPEDGDEAPKVPTSASGGNLGYPVTSEEELNQLIYIYHSTTLKTPEDGGP